MAQSEGDPGRKVVLPEVPLQWVDFMWALERLRHKPYGRKMRERDWFRINPLEMVLLGSQTLHTLTPATRDHGTMLLVMEPLGEEMRSRPRYWPRLLSVLCGTCQGDTPTLILQRCCSVLMNVWRSLDNFPEFQVSCRGWCVGELGVGGLLQKIHTERGKSLGITMSLELQNFVEEIQQMESSAKEYVHSLLEQSATTDTTLRIEEEKEGKGEGGGLEEERVEERQGIMEGVLMEAWTDALVPVLREIHMKGEQTIPSSLCIQMASMRSAIKRTGEGYTPPPKSIRLQEAISALVSTIRETSTDVFTAFSNMLSILQIISVRREDLNSSASQPDLPASPEQEEKGEERESEGEEEGKGEESPVSAASPREWDSGNVSGGNRAEEAVEELCSTLTTALLKWKQMAGSQGPVSSPDVPSKLLGVAEVILSARPLSQSLSEASDFFQWPVTVLMTYSTEGYLSDSPHAFFVELLEYVASLTEQGTPPMRALQSNLPNLFGPVFGVRSHAISCRLLEYGYLAACSQHQKSLLTEGLRFLMEVYRLFPSLDEIRAQTIARMAHVEAMEICQSVLQDILQDVLKPLPQGEGLEYSDTSAGVLKRNGVELEREGERIEVTATDSTSSEQLDDEGEREKVVTEQPEVPVEVENERQTREGEGEVAEEGGGELSQEEEERNRVGLVLDVEWQVDREARLQVLLRLFQLACAMIRNGDNISFLYASILPKLFHPKPPDVPVKYNKEKLQKFFGEEPPPPPTNTYITWNVDKKKLAIQLLDLAILSVENDVATPFQLCGIVVPKLARNLDRMRFSDDEKLSLTIDVLRVTQDTLEAGHTIDELISHGIDLLSNLLPESASGEELRQFIDQLARQFVISSHTSLLFLVKNSCEFMRKSFPGEVDGIQELFRTLIYRGKRDEIRGVFRVCREQLKEGKFSSLRQALYGYGRGSLSHRQLVALCELLIAVIDVEKPQRSEREFRTSEEEEEEERAEQERKEKRERERTVISKLTYPCLKEVEHALREDRFKREVWEKVSTQVSQIALFRTLFESEFASFVEFSTEELLEMFKSKFPPEVLTNERTMQLLAQSATRIEHMQTPQFDSLKVMLSEIVKHFLTLELTHQQDTSKEEEEEGQGEEEEEGGVAVSNKAGEGDVATTTKPPSPLESRVSALLAHLASLPRNAEDRRRLEECGYSGKLWEERLTLTVKTDGSHSLEENMRQTMLACYREFSDILKQMAFTHVSVDGEMVKVTDLFDDELSLTDLKGRRAIAVRMIDQRLGRAKEGHFYERKVALLAREDEIESDFEKQAKAPLRPKTFTVALNTGFFDCARCCGPQIIGCYAPTGEHCEKPMEIGMRCDSAIASIYDESGMEIENLEILLTEEGAYLFKAYSNGHPYDTSQVWVGLFTALLREPSPLVPAIVVPKGFPNLRTWEALRRCISSELTGSILTCRHDFSPEWRTYYDRRPERVRLGTDIVLHPGFTLTADQSLPLLQRQRSRFTKDLAGLIFEDIMQELLEDEWLKQFRFLGKVMAQYISVCVQEGERKGEIIAGGFDYEKWKKIFSKMAQPPVIPDVLKQEEGLLPTREQIVQQLLEFVDEGIVRWCRTANLVQLCVNNHKQLLELKGFLEKNKCFPSIRPKLQAVRELLSHCMFMVPLLSLPEALQEEIIHWVFRNEDRVWRYRGGRDGHETLQQFMNFLGRGQEQELELGSSQQTAYAGVVVFCLPYTLETGRNLDTSTAFQVTNMIGYAVGEMARPLSDGEDVEVGLEARWRPNNWDCYEVVTTWVHPRYRALNLSVQMYLEIGVQVPSRLVMFDMLQGSVERIIHSNWLLHFLDRLWILRLVLQRRQRSYTVVTQTGLSEQFEQVICDVRPMRVVMKVYHVAKWVKAHPLYVTLATVAIATIPIVLLTGPKFLKRF